jgi:hypothetical protein
MVQQMVAPLDKDPVLNFSMPIESVSEGASATTEFQDGGQVIRKSTEIGQTLVEYALMLSFLLTLTFASLEFGRAIYARNTITYAAMEGARYAMTHPFDVAGTQQRVVDSSVMLTLAPEDVTVQCSPCTRGSPITVSVTYHFVSNFSLVVPEMTFSSSAKYYIR